MQGYLTSIFIKQSTSTSNIFLAYMTVSDSNTINRSVGRSISQSINQKGVGRVRVIRIIPKIGSLSMKLSSTLLCSP